MVAGEPPERERQHGIAARVVERMARLVEKRLVVVDAALRAGDQVHDARRVGGDDAGARRLLRPVLEIGADTGLGGEIEAEVLEGGEADGDAPLLRVHRLERRQPADPRHVRRGRRLLALGPEQAVEPSLALRRERGRALDARTIDRIEDGPKRDLLLVLVARDRIGYARDVGLEPVARGEQRAPLVVERRRDGEHRVAERVAARVLGLERESCLGRPQRQLVAVPRTRAASRAFSSASSCSASSRVTRPSWHVRRSLAIASRSPSSAARLGLAERVELLAREESAYRATIAACSEVSFSPTRTARASSERSIP